MTTTPAKVIRILLACCLLVLAGMLGQASAQQTDNTDDIVTPEQFKKLFPNAKQVGQCYLLRLPDGCEAVAVSTYYTSDFIAFVIIQGKSKAAVHKASAKLADLLSPRCKIERFIGSEHGAIIYCPFRGVGVKTPPYFILSPYPTASKNAQIYGWQGRRLRVKLDTEEKRASVEALIDFTPKFVDCIELHVKQFSDEGLQNFLRLRTWNATFVSLKTKDKSTLRAEYSGYTPLVYVEARDFCAFYKGKNYYIGTLTGVRNFLKEKKHIDTPFPFPTEETPWPDPAALNDDTPAKQDPPTPVDSAPEKPKKDTPTPEPEQPAEPTPPVTPPTHEELLKLYLESLNKL